MKNTFNHNKVSNKEAGIVFVLLALTLPILLFIISLVWAIQYTEGVRREDQTMVDAASMDAAIALDSTKWGYNMAIVKALESVRTQLISEVTSNRRDKIINELDKSTQTLLDWMYTAKQVNGVNAEEIFQGHTEYIKHNTAGLEAMPFHQESDSEFCFGSKGNNCELIVQIQRGRLWPQNVVDRWNNDPHRPIPATNFIYQGVRQRNDSDFHGQSQVSSNVAALNRFEPFEPVSSDKVGTFANSNWSDKAGSYVEFAEGTPNFVAANAVRVIVRRRLNLWMTLASFFKSDTNDFNINEEALAVGGDVGDVDPNDPAVRVAPFAIPACALIDPSGDYNPAYSCHLDRYFTNSDRFTLPRDANGNITDPVNRLNVDPVPGAYWGPLTESEYCDSPLDNTAIDSNRNAMCECARSPKDGEEGMPCSDANGSKSVSCTFNAWQSHVKASNYYGVVGIPESAEIHTALGMDFDADPFENNRAVYRTIFNAANWVAADPAEVGTNSVLRGYKTAHPDFIRGGTIQARLGDRFKVSAIGLDSLGVGDDLWGRMTGQDHDCQTGACNPGTREFETEYPFHNAGRLAYTDDELIKLTDGSFVGSAHKDLGFWYTLGRVHDKLGYPQVFGNQKSPLYSLYEAVGKGYKKEQTDAHGRRINIEYSSKMPRVEDWAIGPNACEDAPQFGTCGSRRVRYDTEDNEPTLHRHKYLTPAANLNLDPKVDPEAWTIYPGRTEGSSTWGNIWGGVMPHLNKDNNNWNDSVDRPGKRWHDSYLPPKTSDTGPDCNANSVDRCNSCKDYEGCPHGYVWNQRTYDNAYDAYAACLSYQSSACGGIPVACGVAICGKDECNCEDDRHMCKRGICYPKPFVGAGGVRTQQERELRKAYCEMVFTDVCIEGQAGDNQSKFLEEVCKADKKKEQEECAKAGAAESCAINNDYKDYYSDDCEADYDENCGRCPPDDPDCHTDDEKSWCESCSTSAMDECIEERAAEILESGQCKIDESDCEEDNVDNYNREGILPDFCDNGEGYANYKNELAAQRAACLDAGDNMSCYNINQSQNARCKAICESCKEIVDRGKCCWSPKDDLTCGSEDNYWPSESIDGWRTSNSPTHAAYDPVYSDFGFCGQQIVVNGLGFKATVDALNDSSLADAVYCKGDGLCQTIQSPYYTASISEFSCPFMPQYMPYALLNNDQTTFPGEKYTPDNTRVWRVAIPVIADVTQGAVCNPIANDDPVSEHGNNWIVVGFVETVIFDTDVGLGIQHAPGISHSSAGQFPYTCDYEQGYAIKAKAGSQMIDGVLESLWVDLRHGRKPWQFTPDFNAHEVDNPVDDEGTEVACNMVRARIACESQLLASRDFGRNAIRKVRVVSK